MNIEDVHISEKPLVVASPMEVEGLESQLWITFPVGYREYVTTLGEGLLSDFVRIYPPWRIEEDLKDWRRRINKFWFWDKGRELLPKERALECVIVGDTMNGDELVFHPTRPSSLFVMPRGGEKIFLAGDNLLGAVDWMCSSGKLAKRFTKREFEPFDSRKEAIGKASANRKGEALDEILELGKRWAKRYSPRRSAQKDMKEHLDKDKKASLICEAFQIEGEDLFQPGYLAVYRIDDKESGLELGVFTWQCDDESPWYSYKPNKVNIANLRKRK